jgi:hypothetical protein
MNINNYQGWITDQDNWREMDSIIFRLGPVFQIFRGILYGIVLLMIKEIIVYSKYGVIKLFLIMIILGIFNTPGPGPGSIEEFIYMVPKDVPLNIALGGTIEIMIQNLLFCIIVCTKWKELKNKIFNKKVKNI